MRTPLLAGNWKMYKTPAQTVSFFQDFVGLVARSGNDIVICPPFVNIPAAVAAAAGSKIEIGGQNLHWKTEGAFTGEISGPMLTAAGAKWVIVGHSERRQFFGETDETVLERSKAAIDAGLRPIVCLGERLEERKGGKTEEVLRTQFQGGLAPLEPKQFAKVVIAYEPVWAIGTGQVATPEMAQDAHRCIRQMIASKFGDEEAATTRVLYGGSVKPDNVAGLMSQPDLDGALVGGASLEPKSFAQIVNLTA